MEDLKTIAEITQVYFTDKFIELLKQKTELSGFLNQNIRNEAYYAAKSEPAPPPCCGECGRPLEDEDEGWY